MTKRLVSLLLAVMLLCGVTITGVRAYYSDTETSAGNTFTSSTLDVATVVSGNYSGSASYYHLTAGSNGVNGKVVLDQAAPGQSGMIEWVISNSGNLPGVFTMSGTVAFAENGVTTVESLMVANGTTNNAGSNGDLDQYVMVTLQKGTGSTQAAAEGNLAYINGSTPWAMSGLQAIINSQGSQAMTVSPGATTYVVYRLVWSITGTDSNINVIQSDTAQVDITFNFAQ